MNFGGMKVLMIATDRNLFVPGSAVAERTKEYGNLVEELHLVVLADSAHGLKDFQLAPNIWIYSTNANFKFLRPFAAARLGKKIVFEKKFVRGRGVITTQDPFECGWAGLKVKRKWRLPLEVQLHTDPFSPHFNGFLNIIRKRLAKKVLSKADKVRVVSHALQTKITPFTRAAISVLPIYVDKEKIENAPISFDVHTRYPWRFILLAVSRLTEEKNLPLAFKILSLVRAQFPDTGLLVVGSGVEERKLKATVKKFKLDGAVAFVGWQNDLGPYYKTANLFLQTSFFEGYGLSLVEAGLSGLPVVTTSVGLACELEHGKDAYIFPIKHPELFAEVIMDLIEHNAKRENLKLNLKKVLDTKLISKDNYLSQMKTSWEETATKIK